ncbi:MAG: cyclic nucleotide-binding domain-containing protein [Desulfofustis sp.]|nr:cyclic nucleotide-binding domain-containing protein [Desulfofustis sp.]
MADLKELFSTHTSVELEDSEIATLSDIAEQQHYEKGEVLFEADDPGDSIFLVASGAVDLFTIINGDIEQTLLAVREGGFVGIMALIDDGTRDINARISESADLYRFEKDSLSQIISDGAELGLKLLRLIADITSTRTRIVLSSLRQNLEWTMQVSGLAALDISQLIVDQVKIKIEMINGKNMTGTIIKAEEHPQGYELFVKTGDGTIHFIPYHAIVSASFPLGDIGSDTSRIKGM